MKEFMLDLWSNLFLSLKNCTPFRGIQNLVSWISKTFGYTDISNSYGFVEIWVLVNSLASCVFLIICSSQEIQWWEYLALAYGLCRIYEIFVIQVNVLLFDAYRARRAGERDDLGGYRRIIILLLHNYLEIIFWFALIYRNSEWAFDANEYTLNSFFSAVNYSFFVMTTFGHTFISPNCILGELAILSQSIMGLFMTLLIFSRFISLLPHQGSLNKYENPTRIHEEFGLRRRHPHVVVLKEGSRKNRGTPAVSSRK
jgi:hypothetical protein